MDKITQITADELKDVAASHGFNQLMIVKDYYVTLILYLLRNVEGIYFKGGTALQKIFLNYSRLSEDADYSVTVEVDEVKKKIENILGKSGYFTEITRDKHVQDFVRFVAHYKDPFGEEGSTYVDLNKRAKLLLGSESYEISHFYPGKIPKFSLKTLAKDEMIAEKMAATIGRNKPRDHYDLYKIVQKSLNIDIALVKRKCKLSNTEFSIIKMFNRAKLLKSRWDEDMVPLLKEEVTFQEVMKELSRHFKYSEEKKKLKERD